MRPTFSWSFWLGEAKSHVDPEILRRSGF